MIITCTECSTNFKLDDSLIKETGSNVRCSVCKHLFTAYPVPPITKTESEAFQGLELESDQEEDAFEASSELDIEDDDFSLMGDDTDLESESGDFTEEEEDFSFEESEENEFEMDDGGDDLSLEAADDDDLDFEEDGIEFEAMDDDAFSSLEDEENDLSMEMENDTELMEPSSDIEPLDENTSEETSTEEDEFELEFDMEDDFEDIEPALSAVGPDDMSLEAEAGPTIEDSGLSLEESREDPLDENIGESMGDENEMEPPIITPEEDFSEYDEILAQTTEPEDDFSEEDTITVADTLEEEIAIEKPEPLIASAPNGTRQRRKKKKSFVGAPVMILLLLFLLVAGAYIASIMTGYKIPYLSDIRIPVVEKLVKQGEQLFNKTEPEVVAVAPAPDELSVNGRFVTNATAGTLFVITGKIVNTSTVAYSNVEIRGVLITKDNAEAKTKKAFCGNIISEEMLTTGNISDINKLLVVKEGANNSNVNIQPGANVRFMVVFSDLPEKLQNFTIKVTSFDTAENTKKAN